MLPLSLLLLLSSAPVSVDFDGTLKEALAHIAQAAELNVVVIGELSEPAQVRLRAVDGETALGAVAAAHGLELSRQGDVLVLRRAGVPMVAPAAVVPPLPVPPAAEEGDEAASDERVATGPVTIGRGQRVKSAVAFGGPVVVEEGAVVDGDVVAFGGDVELRAGARVDGDAVAFGGTVHRGAGAQVSGDAVSLGGSGLGPVVARNVLKSRHADAAGNLRDPSRGFPIARFLLEFAALFGVGFVVLMLAPHRVKTIENTIRAEPWKNGFAGALGLLALAPLSVLLIITVVGIPVAFLLWLAAAVAAPVGVALVAHLLGAKLPTGPLRKTQALALALGLALTLLVFQIPVLGGFALFLVITVSLGGILRTRAGQPARGTPIIDPLGAPA